MKLLRCFIYKYEEQIYDIVVGKNTHAIAAKTFVPKKSTNFCLAGSALSS